MGQQVRQGQLCASESQGKVRAGGGATSAARAPPPSLAAGFTSVGVSAVRYVREGVTALHEGEERKREMRGRDSNRWIPLIFIFL